MAPDSKEEPYLGGEKSLLDPKAEKEGVEAILEALTDEEKALMPDPAMPIRHLRAEKGNVAKAIEKLKAALQWRQDFDVDNLVKAMTAEGDDKYKQLLERENATGKIYTRGYDKDGRALMYMFPTRDNTEVEEDKMKHLVWNLEKAIACTKRKSTELGAEEPLEKVNLVIDYAGFTLSDAPPVSTSRYSMDILQKHYPERMHRAYLLNTPFVFRAFWAVVRPFVDPVTKEKLVFCSTAGKKGSMDPLHNNLDNPKALPKLAGGEREENFDSKAFLYTPWDKNLADDELTETAPPVTMEATLKKEKPSLAATTLGGGSFAIKAGSEGHKTP